MRVISLFALCALVFTAMSAPAPLSAQGVVRVFVDGDRVAFDQPPIVLESRILVPLRGVFEKMGATVTWENDTRTVLAVRGNTVVELVIGRRSAQVNNRTLPLDVPAMIVGGRTLVPLRFISESMGASVEWQDATRTVLISTGSAPVGQPPPAQPPAAPPQAAPRTFSGTLVEIRTGETPRIGVEIGEQDRRIVRASITPDTSITRVNVTTNTGGAVSLNALKMGDEAEVVLGAENRAERIRATFKTALGRVDSVGPRGRGLVLTNGQRYRLAEHVEVVINDQASNLGALRRGMVVTLRMNPPTDIVWGITAESVAGQEPPTRPGRPSIATPESGAAIASPLDNSGTAEATRVLVRIDSLLGVRLGAADADVGQYGRYAVSLSYQNVFSGWPIVVTVMAVNRFGLESDPATVTVRQR